MYSLSVGYLSGVYEGTRFDIFDESDLNAIVGTLVVVKSDDFKAELAFVDAQQSFDVPRNAIAAKLPDGPSGDRVTLAVEDDALWSVCKPDQADSTSPSSGPTILRAESGKKADMSVSRDENDVVFSLLYEDCVANGLTRMPPASRVPHERKDVQRALRSAAHFCWNLRHSLATPGFDQVTFECFELKSSNGSFVCKPGSKSIVDPTNFSGSTEMPTSSGTIRVKANVNEESTQAYGFRLQNKSAWDLYASIFYFDCSDSSICECSVETHTKGANYVVQSLTTRHPHAAMASARHASRREIP